MADELIEAGHVELLTDAGAMIYDTTDGMEPARDAAAPLGWLNPEVTRAYSTSTLGRRW